MSKIYTSRFSNAELKSGKYTVVGIVRSLPKYPLGYRLDGNIEKLAPGWRIFRLDDRSEFTPGYYSQLDRIGVDRIRKAIEAYDGDKDIVLCCFEDIRKPDLWCHRSVFAEWWQMRTGEVIEELPDPNPPKYKKGERKPEDVKDPHIQLSMF